MPGRSLDAHAKKNRVFLFIFRKRIVLLRFQTTELFTTPLEGKGICKIPRPDIKYHGYLLPAKQQSPNGIVYEIKF